MPRSRTADSKPRTFAVRSAGFSFATESLSNKSRAGHGFQLKAWDSKGAEAFGLMTLGFAVKTGIAANFEKQL